MHHSFDIEHAKLYGVGEAVLINHFQFWIGKNKANGKHFYEGKTWTYNSISAFTDLFPYYSAPQIKRLLQSLKDQGVVVTGNFNKYGPDRTLWYAFADEDKFIDSIYPFSENALSIRRNRKMDGTKSENALDEIVQPIPDNNTDNKTTNKGGDQILKEKQNLSTSNTPSKETKSSAVPDLVFPPSVSETFREKWKDWLDYKLTSHGFRYKTAKSEQIAINALWDLADKNELNAIAILSQSIMNGWEGLFQVRSPQKNNPETKSTYKSPVWKTDWN